MDDERNKEGVVNLTPNLLLFDVAPVALEFRGTYGTEWELLEMGNAVW